MLDAARAEAERLLAAARTRGQRPGAARRAAMLAEAEAEAAGDPCRRRRRGAASCAAAWPWRADELVAELTALLLIEEP